MDALVRRLDIGGETHAFALRDRIQMLPQLSRYAVVSLLALAVDYSVYLSLVSAGMKAALAGMIGYSLGLLLHFVLSACFVFDAAAARKAPVRLFGEFALSGMAGLAVTTIVIATATDGVGLPALPAKILATGTSFLLVYSLRRGVVFAARR